MLSPKTKVTLLQHPTVALKIYGFDHEQFGDLAESGIYLGNVYRRLMPASLLRVASVMEQELPTEVEMLDLRVLDPDREEIYKTLDWEGYTVEARMVGAPLSYADEAISSSDWIGLSSHFTFESDIVKQLIARARKVNPSVRIMVGGADVTARPHAYINAGADVAFVGDFDSEALSNGINGSGVVGPHRQPFNNVIKPAFEKLPCLSEYRDSHDGKVPDGVPFPIGFIYFTRGCPRECDFCESRKTRYEVLDLDLSITMLQHYLAAGIRTLNLSDDNLLLQVARPKGRASLLSLLAAMRDMGFAWEFPNGLEIGRLLNSNGLDEELMEALFSHSVDPQTGRITGAYRLYVPIETFDRRSRYRKLKPVEDQNKIITGLARSGLLQVDFGVVIPPTANRDTFQHIKNGYLEIEEMITSDGNSKARYAVFHLIPIAEFRSMATKYSIEQFPEGWNFHFPVYDGTSLSARQLFEERLRLIKEIDPQNYLGSRRGEYNYA